MLSFIISIARRFSIIVHLHQQHPTEYLLLSRSLVRLRVHHRWCQFLQVSSIRWQWELYRHVSAHGATQVKDNLVGHCVFTFFHEYRHEIQPNYSSITCTSKKIEIKFIKSERAHWGSMADICEESEDDNESNSPGLKLDLADLNKWNPVVPQPPTSQAVVLFDDKQNMSGMLFCCIFAWI